MSKKSIFSVLDTAANAFGTPFTVNHVGLAVRELTQAVNSTDPQVVISQFPEQFALYHLAEYDDTTGEITPLERPLLVTQAAALKN